MEQYESLEMEVILFEADDVIATSVKNKDITLPEISIP